MSKKLAPCRGCAERHPHCHGECERYKEYQKENEENKEGYRKSLIYDAYIAVRLKRGQK